MDDVDYGGEDSFRQLMLKAESCEYYELDSFAEYLLNENKKGEI